MPEAVEVLHSEVYGAMLVTEAAEGLTDVYLMPNEQKVQESDTTKMP